MDQGRKKHIITDVEHDPNGVILFIEDESIFISCGWFRSLYISDELVGREFMGLSVGKSFAVVHTPNKKIYVVFWGADKVEII